MSFLDPNTGAIIALSLTMIMVFLAYIAYRLAELKGFKKPSRSKA